MKKRILSLILVASLALTGLAGCNSGSPSESQTPSGSGSAPSNSSESSSTPEAPATKLKNQVIIGNTTDLSGDFIWPGFGAASAGAADQDIMRLTQGHVIRSSNQGGAYIWDPTVVKEHTETEDENGNLVISIEINPGLQFSDGTEIKAENYVAYILAFSSKVAVNAGHPANAGNTMVGFDSFKAYVGEGAEDPSLASTNATRAEKGLDPIVPSKVFTGVRLLGDYKFSVTVAAPDYYPSYYAENNAALTPYPMAQVLGEGVELKDDGEGCYLSESWYEKGADSTAEALTFTKSEHLTKARYDLTSYPYSGPYVVKEWDSGTKQATLEINPMYQGNFEGQKPSIKTVVYTRVTQETQLEMLKTGGVDVIAGITGGEDTKAALNAIAETENNPIAESGGKLTENHYQRAGYGKIQFDCDFSPTMFQEVRQAVTYLLNRTEFCQTFTGGYGAVVSGPYSPDFDMWQAVKDDIELNDYDYSPDTAKKVLEDGGWIYNSKGEPYVEGATGVDTVRYKKLTAEEAEACNGVNKTYASVANDDGITYQTVEINGEYYMPLVINWFGTQDNSVTDLLGTSLANNPEVTKAGMVIRSSQGDFTLLQGNIYREASYGYLGVPTYSMYNLATSWPSAVYDYSYNWSLDPDYFGYSSDKLYDEYDKAFPYYGADGKHTKMSLEEAKAASGDKLGMDYISMAMIYDSANVDEYNAWWMEYIERWNQLMPEIPLYSNYYYDAYNAKIENYHTSPFWGAARAVLYTTVANAAD